MGCQCAHNKDEENNEVLKQNPEGENENTQGLDNKLNPNLNNNFNEENVEVGEQFQSLKTAGQPEQQLDHNVKYSDYPQKMLDIINSIRTNPSAYADYIEQSIANIVEEIDKQDGNKPKIIYKKKVKVALTRGEEAFRDAAEKLRNMEPVEPLEFRDEICIPLPENEEEIKDSSYLKEQVRKLREEHNIDVFLKDLIKIPEVSALLMVVDDSGKNPGKKRQAVLNQDFKYIGISSKFIGKSFVAYLSFSK